MIKVALSVDDDLGGRAVADCRPGTALALLGDLAWQLGWPGPEGYAMSPRVDTVIMRDAPGDYTSDVDSTTLLAVMQALAHAGPEGRKAAVQVVEQATRIVLTPDDLAAVQERMIIKDQARRFHRALALTAQMLEEGPGLVRGDRDQRLQDWADCVESVENLWRSSAALWRDGYYPPATALAISTIEEAGKLAVERFRLLGVEHMVVPEDVQAQGSRRRRGTLFRDHLTKHVMAAMTGALINVRVDRVLGIDFINEFLDLAEGKKLEKLRQSCLYLDRAEGALQNPKNAISPVSSARYVALAGEVLAEVLPAPSQWQQMIGLVRKFERAAGLPDE